METCQKISEHLLISVVHMLDYWVLVFCWFELGIAIDCPWLVCLDHPVVGLPRS